MRITRTTKHKWTTANTHYKTARAKHRTEGIQAMTVQLGLKFDGVLAKQADLIRAGFGR